MSLTDLFTELVKLPTLDCLKFAGESLLKQGYDCIWDGANWARCTPQEPSPIALVAHCDTVGKAPPVRTRNRGGIIDACGEILGADDRAGVAAILWLVASGLRPQVYLTTGEETGCIGARALCESGYKPPDTLHVLLQLDRQGGQDFVTYDCLSEPMDDWITEHGFVKSVGSCSDISVLAPWWGIAAANLSVGYYGQHWHSERLVVPQLQHTIDRVTAMLANPPQERFVYRQKPKEVVVTYWGDDDGKKPGKGHKKKHGKAAKARIADADGLETVINELVKTDEEYKRDWEAYRGNKLDDTDVIEENEFYALEAAKEIADSQNQGWFTRGDKTFWRCPECMDFAEDGEFDFANNMCGDCVEDLFVGRNKKRNGKRHSSR